MVTGLTVTDGHPLQPIGDAFQFVGDKIENAKLHFTQVAEHCNEVKARTLALKENIEKSIDGLRDFIASLKDVGLDLREIGGGKLLSLAPAVAAGFFVFIHLAFAVAGYAMLSM